MLGLRRTQTRHIGQKSAQSIYYAFEHAKRLGLPLNVHVTINFAATRCEPHRIVGAFSDLRRTHLKRWLARQQPALPHTAVYAFENVRDGVALDAIDGEGGHNLHVHWVVHMPARLRHDFEQQVFGWVDKVSGGVVDPRAVVKFTEPPQATLRSYVLKGCVQQWAAIYGAEAQDQGLVIGGLRANTTANLRRSKRIAFDRAEGVVRRMPARPSTAYAPPPQAA